MENSKISLSTMIQTLREELETAQEQSKNSRFKFRVDSVELELAIEVSKGKSGTGGIQFWVLEAGAEVKKENSHAHKFTLVLKPGSSGPIEVARESQTRISDQ
jgi:hypothetical protein